MVEAGLPPHQALASATRTSAQILGFEQTGVIAPGYRANLVLLPEDPLIQTSAVEFPVAVMLAGYWMHDIKLEELREAARDTSSFALSGSNGRLAGDSKLHASRGPAFAAINPSPVSSRTRRPPSFHPFETARITLMKDVSLHALRLDLARKSFWNIGYFAAGFIFWTYVLAVEFLLPLEVAKIFWLVGTFFIFPVAVFISWLLGTDPFLKGNILGELVGYTHLSVITFTFPVIVVAMVYFPEAMLLLMAIAYCLDFYVMTWAFGSPLFGIHAAVRVVVVSAIWFTTPEWRDIVLPATVALIYLITTLAIPILRTRWLTDHVV